MGKLKTTQQHQRTGAMQKSFCHRQAIVRASRNTSSIVRRECGPQRLSHCQNSTDACQLTHLDRVMLKDRASLDASINYSSFIQVLLILIICLCTYFVSYPCSGLIHEAHGDKGLKQNTLDYMDKSSWIIRFLRQFMILSTLADIIQGIVFFQENFEEIQGMRSLFRNQGQSLQRIPIVIFRIISYGLVLVICLFATSVNTFLSTYGGIFTPLIGVSIPLFFSAYFRVSRKIEKLTSFLIIFDLVLIVFGFLTFGISISALV